MLIDWTEQLMLGRVPMLALLQGAAESSGTTDPAGTNNNFVTFSMICMYWTGQCPNVLQEKELKMIQINEEFTVLMHQFKRPSDENTKGQHKIHTSISMYTNQLSIYM